MALITSVTKLIQPSPPLSPASAAAPSRESFYALYFDHARDFWKVHLCRQAKISGSYALLNWDELTEAERVPLREEIFFLVGVHEHNAKQIAKAGA